MPAPLDTLQIVKRLKEAGFAEPQAEALTAIFRDSRDADFSVLATKADIERVENRIERIEARLGTFATKADIERIEARLGTFPTKADIERIEAKFATKTDLQVAIAELKVEVIRWVFGIAFAQAALILAVLKLFPGAHP
jgi:hypothetical protein